MSNEIKIPIEVSARHVHLTVEHLNILFGKGHKLKKFRDLSMPGQFAAEEEVALVGPHGRIDKVRLIGPCRDHTQVEISKTDARILGIDPPVRESSNVTESAPIKVVGPQGEVELSEGAIIAQRHLHLDPQTARQFELKTGDIVNVRIEGERGLVFHNVFVRVSVYYSVAMHVDTDEANAAGIDANNKYGYLII